MINLPALNFLIYLAIFYASINIFGFVLEKIKIPRIYAALFLGILLSVNSSIAEIISLNFSKILSRVGMFTLLFLLGYNLSLKKLEKYHKLIFKITFWVIASELTIGTLVLHFFFNVNWFLASVIAISFATVGEVALLPILKEFKLVKTKLGQIILGVAIVDDLVEILAFVLLIAYMGSFAFSEIFQELTPLVAICTGVIFAKVVKRSKKFDKVIEIASLFVFGPLFFFYAGTEANLSILVGKFMVILLFTLAIKATKITSAFLTSHKELGTKKSIIVGISLGIKFSTSIIILIILLQKRLITEELFSVLIGIKVMFKFIVPILLSYLLSKWHLEIAK